MIPIVNPTLLEWESVIQDFRQAWDSGQVTTGFFTKRFEDAVEKKLQVPHAVMVQSCTAGLMLVLRALELQGQVIMPAFTWTATAHAAMWNGLQPVFADIQPDVYTLDPEKVVAAINSETAAIMPVNVFGCPPDYEAFEEIGKKNGLPIIYDSAQGLGSRYLDKTKKWKFSGNFGDAEIFSMSPTKVVSAMEAGLITMHDEKLAQKLRQMRDYGKTSDGEDIAWLGLSARVPEINAIVAYYNFRQMDQLITRRQELIDKYKEKLKGLRGITFQEIPGDRQTSGNYLTIFIDSNLAKHSRDEVFQFLKERQIQAKKYFYPALHQQKVYVEIGRPYKGNLPVTEKAAISGLALPCFSHITEEMVITVIDSVKTFFQ
jgi:dTDP-4-amino-4,6-dideoxygalactose transaminase